VYPRLPLLFYMPVQGLLISNFGNRNLHCKFIVLRCRDSKWHGGSKCRRGSKFRTPMLCPLRYEPCVMNPRTSHFEPTPNKSVQILTPYNNMDHKTKYNPAIHHRRSIRLKGYDYSQNGLYFITICTYNREYWFGDILYIRKRF